MRKEPGFLEDDWPEDLTSHCFEEAERTGTSPPFVWYQCVKCEGWKLVHVSDGLHGKKNRSIWEKEPEDMTMHCPMADEKGAGP